MDPALAGVVVAMVTGGLALIGVFLQHRATREANVIAKSAKEISDRAGEFLIIRETLGEVVEDQKRMRVALDACHENETRIIAWMRQHHPDAPPPNLLPS